MLKKVVLVGHCGPDSSFLRVAVGSAQKGLAVVSADDEQSLREAIEQGADLLLVNRVLDYGFDEASGAAVIRRLRKDYPQLKMMLVSNYTEAQAEAVAAGALPGFGKRELGSSRVAQVLRQALES
jgi:CheY-like chemotaxis protein